MTKPTSQEQTVGQDVNEELGAWPQMASDLKRRLSELRQELESSRAVVS